MCRFLETIKLNNGEFYRLKYHQDRINNCFAMFYPDVNVPDLSVFLSHNSFPEEGLWKCRVLYDLHGFQKPEIIKYEIRDIKTMKIIETDLEAMTYKSTERQAISKLYDLRGDCDDVLLVRNGCVADSSYTNIAMFDGDKWITPKRPIIFGTNRAYLLDNNLITEGDIAISDISKFQKIRMFNAMIEFGEIELDISSIILK